MSHEGQLLSFERRRGVAKSGVLYGPTGSLKTSQVKWFAHYIAETTGKSTLLLSTDGGGWEPCEPEIQAGMIRAYRPEMTTLPLIILRKISQGYWPKDTGETDPARINLVPIDWNEVGGIAVEGWTSISQVIMRYLPDRGINVGGEDRAKLGGFAQEMFIGGQLRKEDFRSNTRGDYGFVQQHLYGLVMNFNALPVRYVLYTALESKTEDDDRTTVFGPAISGKKATSQCGAWVGDMIHAQDYPVPRTVQVPDPQNANQTLPQTIIDTAVRYHFKKHPDPATGIMFPAKPRVTPEQTAELDKRFPGGYFEPKTDGSDSFAEYLRTLDRLAGQQADTLKGWRERMDAKLRPRPQAAATTTTK
jgi:hypothetical protein